MSDEAPPQPAPADGNPDEPKVDQEALRREEQLKRREEQLKRTEQDLKKMEQALKGALSGLAKTACGSSFAYVKLTLAEKEIQRLHNSLDKFVHVRHLDLSTNQIQSITPLLVLPNITTLNLAKNQISSLAQFSKGFAKLQILNLSTNKLTELGEVSLPALRRLNLNQNEIKTAEHFKGHASLELLQLRKNKLKKLAGLKHMPVLTQLYVCENQLTDIRGLQELPELKRLYLRNNKVKKFMRPFPFLPSLKHLNLRENQVDSLATVQFLVGVDSFNLQANPLCDQLGQNFRKEVVLKYPAFKRVNKADVTKEQREEWIKEYLEKEAERERERLEKEEEERKRLQEERLAAAGESKPPDDQ